MHKIDFYAKNKYDRIQNYKILQDIFTKVRSVFFSPASMKFCRVTLSSCRLITRVVVFVQ
jgi:hypothetical protein